MAGICSTRVRYLASAATSCRSTFPGRRWRFTGPLSLRRGASKCPSLCRHRGELLECLACLRDAKPASAGVTAFEKIREEVRSSVRSARGRSHMPEEVVGGIRLHYDVFGEGEPILLVCGTGQRSFTWQLFQMPALTGAGYRVVTFENPGVPPSDCPPAPYTLKEMAEDAAGLIEHLDLAPCRVA